MIKLIFVNYIKFHMGST